jgi:hypothetical protein
MELEAELRGAEVRDDTLYLDYTVHNGTDRRARLANRLFRNGRADRNAAYTELAPGPVLIVRKQHVEGVESASTPLAPGERLEETIELPLPIPPRHPSAPQPEGPAHEVPAVALVLGYQLEGGPPAIVQLGPVPARVATTIAL